MQITKIFSGRTPKEKENISDCQDYYQDCETTFAIADGSSQSFYPGIWAEMLVNSFCKNPDFTEGNWQDWLKPIQDRWLLEVNQRVETAKNEKRAVWVTNQNRLNFRESATSTFLGLNFTKDQIKISAIGDSCLFVVENNRLVESYLMNSLSVFNDRPQYLASYAHHNRFTPSFITVPLNNSKIEKYFILATDALAELILKYVSEEKDIFSKILGISSQSEFEDFVNSARSIDNITLKNDDVTLTILKVSSNESGIIEMTHVNQNKKIDVNTNDNYVATATKQNLEKINTREEDSGSSINYKRELDDNNTNKVRAFDKQIQSLKLQRGGLIFSILVLLSIVAIDRINKNNSSVVTSPNRPKTPVVISEQSKVSKDVMLSKANVIYKDADFREILINSVSSSSKALILAETNRWIKFELKVYAHQSKLNECSDCRDEIELQANTNIRLSPFEKNNTIFGILKSTSKFGTLKSANSNWRMFKLVGFIKK